VTRVHTVWKGSISFGLVNIPVRLFAATEEKDIRFRYLHKACHTPIEYVRRCPHCNQDVSWDDIVRGYEYEPGKFVVLTEDDWNAVQPEARKAIEILDFVDLSEIDPVYFHKSYYLSPGENGEKAYALLRRAMAETGKIAIARVTLRAKSSLCAVRAIADGLMLETLFYPDEVRSIRLVPNLPVETDLDEKEVRMAVQLVENLSAPFEPEKYTDTYREALRERIAKKIEGEEVKTAPTPRSAPVVDLMAALQSSLEATAKEATPAKRTPRRRKKATG